MTPPPPSIGVLILARNEEPVIKRAVDSVRETAQDVLVLDMESQDRTGAVAMAAGARVINVARRRYFDAARQVGLEQLDTDWVLQLDADEWAPGLLQRIIYEGWLDAGRPLLVPKRNYLGDRPIHRNRWWPNYQVRLFPKDAARYQAQWHRYLVVSGDPLKLPRRVEYAIHHQAADDLEEMVRGVARYLPAGHRPLGLRQQLVAIGRPLAGYLLSRGWRDGADGLAIFAAKVLNECSARSSIEEECDADA